MSSAYHEENITHFSPWPLVVTLGLAVFFIGVAAWALGLGLGVLGLGIIVFAVGAVGWLKETFIAIEEPPGMQWPFEGFSKLKLGVWIFLAGEIMLFGTVLGSGMYLRINALTWPVARQLNISFGTLMTYILLASALTFSLGEAAIRNGNVTGLRFGLILTFLLGAGFIGVKAVEWSEMFKHGISFSSGLAASTYFFTTGLHGGHVIIGLIGLLYFLGKSLMGGITKESHETLTLFGLYWIFVDTVWLFIFPIIYLW